MADVNIQVTRFALSTAASGTQDVTISGFGTPKAAIFIYSEGDVDDTITAFGRMGIGWTDGTNEHAAAFFCHDAQSTQRASRTHRTDRVITYPATGGTEITGFSFDSWITDGVRLTIDDSSASANLVTLILINGADVSNVHAGYKDDLGTGTSAVDVNTVGFEPDLVFMSCIGSLNVPPENNVHSIFSFGIGHNDASNTQRVAMVGSRDTVGTVTADGYVGNDSIVGQVTNGSLTWDAAIGSYDASGFSLTPNASAGSDIVFYLCLKFTNSPDISLFDMTWPTSGSYAETTPGFTPDFGLITSVIGPSSRNTDTASGVFGLSIAAFDGSAVYTQNATEEDAATTSVAKSLSSDQLRILDQDGTTDAVVASSYAFDSQGWDFTLSTNPASAVLGWGLAVGAGGGGGGPTVSPLGHQRLDNQYSAIAASRLNGVLQ